MDSSHALIDTYFNTFLAGCLGLLKKVLKAISFIWSRTDDLKLDLVHQLNPSVKGFMWTLLEEAHAVAVSKRDWYRLSVSSRSSGQNSVITLNMLEAAALQIPPASQSGSIWQVGDVYHEIERK